MQKTPFELDLAELYFFQKRIKSFKIFQSFIIYLDRSLAKFWNMMFNWTLKGWTSVTNILFNFINWIVSWTELNYLESIIKVCNFLAFLEPNSNHGFLAWKTIFPWSIPSTEQYSMLGIPTRNGTNIEISQSIFEKENPFRSRFQ